MFPKIRFAFLLSTLLLFINITMMATTPTVTVTAPQDGATGLSPLQYIATASSPGCAKGIAAMRIYTAPGVGNYTIQGGRLNTYVTLAPGTYNTVVQAWDNCGGVGKASVTVTITGPGGDNTGGYPYARFVYVTEHDAGKVAGYVANPYTGSLAPNGQPPVWAHWGPMKVAADYGGYRLYVVNQGSHDLNAYFINRSNGHLSSVPGSPFSIAGTGSHVIADFTGHYVYATTDSSDGGQESITGFSVASDGSLHPLNGSPYTPPAGVGAMTVDSGSKYLYVSVTGGIAGYAINPQNGELTPVPGSPFLEGEGPADLALDARDNRIYGTLFNSGTIVGYQVDNSTGSLTALPGSPYADPDPPGQVGIPGAGPLGITVEPRDQYLFVSNSEVGDIATFSISELDGSLTLLERTPNLYGGTCGSGLLRADPSGQFVYTMGSSQPECSGISAILGFSIDLSDGSLSSVPNSPFANQYVYPFSEGIAVTP